MKIRTLALVGLASSCFSINASAVPLTLTATPNAFGVESGISGFSIQFDDVNNDAIFNMSELTSFSGVTLSVFLNFVPPNPGPPYFFPTLTQAPDLPGVSEGEFLNRWEMRGHPDVYGIQPVFNLWTYSLSPAAVPLPPALALFASGLGLVGLLGWRRKRDA